MKKQKPVTTSVLSKQSDEIKANQPEHSHSDHTPTDHDHSDHTHPDHDHSDHTHPDHDHSDHSESCHSHTHQNTKAVVNRLSRAIGHLNAVKNMVEDGRDCSEVLIQLAAVRSAINGICDVILQDHIDHCIVEAVKEGDTDAIEELNKAIKLLMK